MLLYVLMGIMITIILISYIHISKHIDTCSKFVPGFTSKDSPYIKPQIRPQFISPEKCKKIIEYSKNKLFESETVGGKDTKIRNSMQYWIDRDDYLVRDIFVKASQQFGVPFDNAEKLQVVRYKPDQYYNEHHDSCCDNNEKCQEFFERGGQRVLTVLVYLNDEFTGGETNFPKLGMKIKPNTGDAVVFYPLGEKSNKCHPLALHAGLPVKSGEKWIANIWFRNNKFN